MLPGTRLPRSGLVQCALCRGRHNAHWSGHPTRLNRQTLNESYRFGDPNYAKEELHRPIPSVGNARCECTDGGGLPIHRSQQPGARAHELAQPGVLRRTCRHSRAHEKGDNIFVEGTLQTRRFTPKDGSQRTVYEVVARSVHQITKTKAAKEASADNDPQVQSSSVEPGIPVEVEGNVEVWPS